MLLFPSKKWPKTVCMPKGTIGQVILVANLNTFGIVTLAPTNQLDNALKTGMPTGTIGPLCVCLQEQMVQYR